MDQVRADRADAHCLTRRPLSSMTRIGARALAFMLPVRGESPKVLNSCAYGAVGGTGPRTAQSSNGAWPRNGA
jgi:hypothetical protein